MLKKLLIIHLLILFSLSIAGQITIGVGKPAKEGALLDLKQNDSPNANSTKGLLLPRVNLESVNNLYPMFIKGYNKNTEDLLHIGLTVYNVNNCFSEGVGPYAWNGEEWTYLIQYKNPDVLIFEDQDGNPFYARKFGDAGIWMTQNLAAMKYDPIRDEVGETLYTDVKIRYPNNDSQLPKDYLWMGVFYNFRTATNNRSEADINNENIHIQGICPNGWHVPTSKEWYKLEAEIIKNTDKYTTLDYTYASKNITQPPLVGGADNQSNYGSNFRPGLIDPCPMPDKNNVIDGVSLKASQGGFAVRMIGVMGQSAPNEFHAVDEYGTKAGFWVADRPNSANGRNRVFLNNSIYNHTGGETRYYSIRCKKN